jgi:hypothetical protein
MGWSILNSEYDIDLPFLYSWKILGEINIPQVYSWKILREINIPQVYSWIINGPIYAILSYSWKILKESNTILSYAWQIIVVPLKTFYTFMALTRCTYFNSNDKNPLEGDTKRSRFFGTK